MRPERPPETITLELTRGAGEEDPSDFSFEPRTYRVRHSDGRHEQACLDWSDQEFQRALHLLEQGSQDPSDYLRIGHHLRKFLEPTSWDVEERRMERALDEERGIDLTLRSDARELYYLPWSLLPLQPVGRLIGELRNCLLRYEWMPMRPSSQSRATGRILFASSAAGGQVPFREHLEAIQAACVKAGFPFEPQRDVLPNVTRKRLASALQETERPVTALHLLCHGAPMGNGSYGLVLDALDSHSDSDKVHAVDFQRLIPQTTSALRLVTLCACNSGEAGQPAHLVGGVAQRVHRRGVPAVLASRLPLSPEGSTRLAGALYSELLCGTGSLRVALAEARERLGIEQRPRDWASLQLYAREHDEDALHPFRPPTGDVARRDLVLIRHEAYSTAPQPVDAPALFEGRRVRKVVPIDQTQLVANRRWKNLPGVVKRMASSDGEFLRALAEPDAEFVYYGFPYVPLAALAGRLAKTHAVHLFEHDREKERFLWEPETGGATYPPLRLEKSRHEAGKAVRLRLSISALVNPDDCRAVLPDEAVGLDLHLALERPGPGTVRWQQQLQDYTRTLRQALHEHVAPNNGVLESIHVFAAVPVTLAFRLGRELAATWLPDSYVYNYGREEVPRYKWRLFLRAAASGKPSIHIF